MAASAGPKGLPPQKSYPKRLCLIVREKMRVEMRVKVMDVQATPRGSDPERMK